MIVDAFNGVLRACVSTWVATFEGISPLLGFVLMSVVAGIAMLWVVGKTSNQSAIERSKKHMQAHLLEMRLFGDDPSLLLRAQKDLVMSNFRYVGHMMRPALFLVLPMVILYGHFDAVYGRRSLAFGESSLVTTKMKLSADIPTLTADGGVAIETGAVRVQPESEISWRLRATGDEPARLTLAVNGVEVGKIASIGDDGFRYISQRRSVGSLERLLLSPGEEGFEAAEVEWLEIEYPTREIGFGGLQAHWVIWFLLISIVTAYLLKGFFGIVL